MIKLKIPKTQVVENELATTPICSFQGVQITCSKDKVDSDFIYISTALQLCNQACPLQTNLTFQITSGFRNPNYIQSVENYFYMSVFSPNGYEITNTQSQSISARPPLKLDALGLVQVSQMIKNVTTGLLTLYTLQFQVQTSLTTDYKALIKFPNDCIALQISTPQIPLNCTNVMTGNQYSCKIQEQATDGYITTIAIDNLCIVQACSALSVHQIQISNVVNPTYVRPRLGQFQIFTVTSDYNPTSEGYFSETSLPVYIPRGIVNLTVVRETTKPGSQYNDLIISFVTPMTIPDQSTLTYDIPFQQVILPDLYSVPCVGVVSPVQSYSLGCAITKTNSSFLTFQVQEWCNGDCQPGTILSLKLPGTTNPTYLNANDPDDSFGLYVQNSASQGIMVEYKRVVAIPPLDGLAMNNMVIARDNSLLGADSNITLAFIPADIITVNTSLIFSFQSNTSFQPSTFNGNNQACLVLKDDVWLSRSCNYQFYVNESVYGLASIKNITIANLCNATNPCQPRKLLMFKFKVSNPRSLIQQQLQIQNNGNVTSNFITTLRGVQYDVGRTSIAVNLTQLSTNVIQASYKLLPNLNALKQDLCTFTGQNCTMILSINTSNPFLPIATSYLAITLPLQISVSVPTTCTALIFGNLSMACRIFTNQQIQVRHTYNLSNFQPPYGYSFPIQVNISRVRLPFSNQESSSFQIATIENYQNTNFIIDQLKAKMTVKMSSTSPFGSIILTRDRIEPGANVTLTVDISLDFQLPSNGQLRIDIPQSQLMIYQGPIQGNICFLNTGTPLQCVRQSGTVFVSGICPNTGCASNTRLIFDIVNSILSNPESPPDSLDPIADSIKVTSQYSIGNSTYQQQSATSGLLIQPPINLTAESVLGDRMWITGVQFDSFQLSDHQVLNFTAGYNTNNFTKDYLRLSFRNAGFYEDQFFRIEATMNNRSTSVNTTATIDDAGIEILDAIILYCDAICKQQQNLSISVKGFLNPHHIQLSKNLTPTFIFGELRYQTSQYSYKSATYQLQNIFLEFLGTNGTNTLVQPFISLNNGTMEMFFSISNNPQIDESAQISISLPQGSSASNIQCQTLFSNITLQCDYSNGTLIITNYFSQIKTVSSNYRRILQSSTNSSASSNSVVGIQLQNVQIVSNSTQQSSSVQISTPSRLYVVDNDSLTFAPTPSSTSSNCSQSTCQQCLPSNTSVCFACQQPSTQPILQSNQCTGQCSNGTFEYNSQCYPCPIGCAQCQTSDHCQQCFNTQTQVLIDGKCVNTMNRLNQQFQCPKKSKTHPQYICASNTGCKQDQCNICGAINLAFCHQCDPGSYSMNGVCVNQCGTQYFSNAQSSCIKCHSKCNSCFDQMQKCASCNKQYYGGLMLDLTQNTCGIGCNAGTIISQNSSDLCEACSEGCLQCYGNKNNCLQCGTDPKSNISYYMDDSSCVRTCPIGKYPNPETLECELNIFSLQSGGPIFLIIYLIMSFIFLSVSKYLSQRRDDSLSIALVLLTQLEFINRVVLLISFWTSIQTWCFCVTGMTMLCTSLLGIYLTVIYIQPLCNQLPSIPAHSILFTSLVTIVQITGPQTARLFSSKFMNSGILSQDKMKQIPYYVRGIEQIGALNTMFNIFQILISLEIVFLTNQITQIQMSFAVNCIIVNGLIVIMESVKFMEYKKIMKIYKQVQ